MKFPRLVTCVAFALGALGAAGCSVPGGPADFANNCELYSDVPFQTKAPGDRNVFVAPVVDARTGEGLPTSDRGFPIHYGDDAVWDRPVVEMVGEVLQRQLASSRLFPEVAPAASPESLVIVPTLVSFLAGAAESVGGSSSFAEVGLRLQVYGPAGSDGKRTLLHDQVYGNRQATGAAMTPPSPYRLACRAMQISMAKALAGLDGSNVGRSNVPIGDATPVPASATK